MSLLRGGNAFQNHVLAVLCGLLLTASFPGVGLDWAAWGALVPLLIASCNVSYWAGFRLGFIAGLVHYLSLMYWLVHTFKAYGQLPLYLGVPVLFLLSAYLALFIGAFAGLTVYLYRRPAWGWTMIPASWVAVEYLRSFLLTGFPWELLGYTQFGRLHLIQISDMLGVYGVSFLLVLGNTAIFLILVLAAGQGSNRPFHGMKAIGVCGCVFAAVLAAAWGYGVWRVRQVDEQTRHLPAVKIAVVQGNIDQGIKWNPQFQVATTKKYIGLSRTLRDAPPDLVVWPETATPFYFLHDLQLSKIVLAGIAEEKSDFLIGSPSYARVDRRIVYFNSAYVMAPGGKIFGKYDKAHLVPFGEYVPLKKWLPFVGKLVAQVGDFQAGEKGKTISWKGTHLGPLICYEVIFPYLARETSKNGAALLVNITNDAWYGMSSAPYQHFSMAVFRAVENRRSLVRSANTGISGFIDPAGRVLAQTGIFEDAVLTRQVPLARETTVYTRFGDVFAQICLVITVIVSVISIIKYSGGNHVYRTQADVQRRSGEN